MTSETKRGSCVVIVRGGLFAAIRSHKHQGRICLPGGKQERGESPVDAAARECLEEIGVVPQGLVAFHVGPDFTGWLCTTFHGTIATDVRLQSSTEGVAFWCSRQELLTNGVYSKHTTEWLPLYDALFGEIA
jgi:8-oxo-dGTP pyrophosphatase MutT (NUDIX family)